MHRYKASAPYDAILSINRPISRQRPDQEDDNLSQSHGLSARGLAVAGQPDCSRGRRRRRPRWQDGDRRHESGAAAHPVWAAAQAYSSITPPSRRGGATPARYAMPNRCITSHCPLCRPTVTGRSGDRHHHISRKQLKLLHAEGRQLHRRADDPEAAAQAMTWRGWSARNGATLAVAMTARISLHKQEAPFVHGLRCEYQELVD